MDALDFLPVAPARRDSALAFLAALRREVAATARTREAAAGASYRCEECGGPARLHQGRVSRRWAAVGIACDHPATFYADAADVPARV